MNGPQVSAVALGSRQLATSREIQEAENEQIIDSIKAAIDAGINFLNTAGLYGMDVLKC